jgi:hypothetical protein
MIDALSFTGALFLVLHGLVHLMGFFAYWPLATIPDLPYKTAVLAGQLELGAVGIQIFSIFWLIPALGFAATSIAMIGRWHRWQSVLLTMTIISFVVTVLDWQVAFRGTIIDLAILLVLLIASQTRKAVPARGH